MKKFYSIALAIILILSALPGTAFATGNYINLESIPDYSNMDFIYENMELNYSYNGNKLLLSKEHITYNEFEALFKVLSDEHLTPSDTKTTEAVNPQDELFPQKGYVEFLDENDVNCIIAFDENAVYARYIDPINKVSSHGFFSYKTDTIYNAFRAFLDNISSKATGNNNITDIQKEQKERHTNLIEIYDMKQIYEASFPLEDFSEGFSWGICSYTRSGNDEPVTTAYMTFKGMEFLRIITEKGIKNNRIIFDNKRIAYFEDPENAIEYDMNFNLTCEFELQLEVDSTGKVSEAVMYFKNVYSGDETVYSSVIDMSSYKQSGYLPSTGKVAFARNSTQNPEIKPGEKKAEEAYSDYDFLYDIKSGSPALSRCSYTYESDGVKRTIQKTQSEMNAYNTQQALQDAFGGYNFTKDAVLSEFNTNTALVEIGCRRSVAPKTKYTIYVYDSYIVAESSVPNPDKTSTLKNIPLYVRYTYSGESIVNKLISHFEKWLDDTPISDTHYTDVSKRKVEYCAEFEFEADEKMLSSWIGEVCENGKVKCKITYFESSSMLTISGNGKSFNLMRSHASSGNSTYTNSSIGVDKDTPIPNEMAEKGYIHLNWSTISGYSSKGELFVRIYDSNGVHANNPGQEGLIGTPKSIIKLGNITDYKTKPNSPVAETEARGNVFEDVAENHWAKKTIENHYYAGIVRGTGNGRYEPDSTMTYEHFAILLKRLFDYDCAYTNAEPALRQDVFKALIDAMNLPYEEYDLTGYTDAYQIKAENSDAVQTAVKANIVEGFAGALNVNGYLTRAEAITLIDRAIKKVYNIDETMKPEYYKTCILPSNGYTTISADKLTDFKAKSEDEEIYIKNDSERLKGKIVVTFGDDVITDSRVYGVFESDGNVFTAESIDFSQIIIRKNQYVLRGNAVVYKNGRIYDDSRSLNVVFNTEDQEVSFGSESQTFYAFFENIRKTLGNEPKEPDIQPYEAEAAQWDGGLIIAGNVKSASLYGEAFGTDNSDAGVFSIKYNNSGNDAKLNITVSKTYPDGGKCIYTFASSDIIQMNDSEIYAMYTMRRDGETVAQNLPLKLSGILQELETTISLSDDTGNFSAELFVAEVGK